MEKGTAISSPRMLKRFQDFLSPSDFDIIAMKYGLEDGRKKTSHEIGALYVVSGQRIRIVAKNIMNRLEDRFGHERREMLEWLE